MYLYSDLQLVAYTSLEIRVVYFNYLTLFVFGDGNFNTLLSETDFLGVDTLASESSEESKSASLEDLFRRRPDREVATPSVIASIE